MKKCIYCDTLYPEEAKECPLCGGTTADIISDEAPKVQFDSETDDLFGLDELLNPAPVPAKQPKADPVEELQKEPRPLPKRAPKEAPKKGAAPKRRPEPEPEYDEDDDDAPVGAAVPRWMTAMICIVLVAALLVGLAFAGYSLGLFNREKPDNSSLSLPVDPTPDTGADAQQPAEQIQQPEENLPSDSELMTPDEPEEPEVPDEPAEPEEPEEPAEPEEPTEPEVPDEPEETVVTVPCTGLSLNTTDVTVFSRGETFKLKPKLTPENCDEPVVFESSDPAYATVDENGLVEAVNGKGGGNIKIKVTCGDYSEECIVRLKFAERAPANTAETTSGFSLSLTDFTMSHRQEEVVVEVKGMNLAYDSVVWSIDDPDIASIRTNKDTAIVSAVASGTTYLRATVNGTEKLVCIVRCSPKMGESASSAEQG